MRTAPPVGIVSSMKICYLVIAVAACAADSPDSASWISSSSGSYVDLKRCLGGGGVSSLGDSIPIGRGLVCPVPACAESPDREAVSVVVTTRVGAPLQAWFVWMDVIPVGDETFHPWRLGSGTQSTDGSSASVALALEVFAPERRELSLDHLVLSGPPDAIVTSLLVSVDPLYP